MNNMCCPKCGNPHLQVVNEVDTQTSGGGYSAGKGCLGYLIFGPLGLLCGACGSGAKTTTTNTTFWVCSGCGYKFRSPDDAIADEEKKKGLYIALGIVTIIFAIVFIILAAKATEDVGEGFGTVFGVGAAGMGIFSIIAFASAGATNKRIEEANSNKQRMRSFTASGKTSVGTTNLSGYRNCPACGARVSSSLRVCSCGASLGPTRTNTVASAANVLPAATFNPATEWKCSACGRVNQNYVGTCACGTLKNPPKKESVALPAVTTDKDKAVAPIPVSGNAVSATVLAKESTDKTESMEYVFCGDCGTKQKNGRKFCLRCGAKLDQLD